MDSQNLSDPINGFISNEQTEISPVQNTDQSFAKIPADQISANQNMQKSKIKRDFFIIAIVNCIMAIFFLSIVIYIQKTQDTYGIVEKFLRIFPSYGLPPIIGSLASVIFLYLGLKIKNISGSNFWKNVFVVCLTLPSSLLCLLSIYPIIVTNNNKISILLSTFVNIPIILIVFMLIIISYKKINLEYFSLSNKSKIFLTLTCFVLLITNLLVIIPGYIDNADIMFSKAEAKVNYHVYKPSILPTGLVMNSLNTDNKFAEKQNAIKIGYGEPLYKSTIFKVIVFQQVGVDTNFNLEDFVSKTNKQTKQTTISQINLPNALNNKGVMVKITGKTLNINSLFFITNDNVLISITSPHFEANDLVQLAKSLR
jgi:hypothetical protein